MARESVYRQAHAQADGRLNVVAMLAGNARDLDVGENLMSSEL